MRDPMLMRGHKRRPKVCPACAHAAYVAQNSDKKCAKHTCQHEADPHSAQLADGAGASDYVVLDFTCKHCRMSGAVAVNLAEISWE